MPRKPIPMTHEFPYHIVARSNNKEQFYLPIEKCWNIFCKELSIAAHKFDFRIYAFVLMSNHYHLIAQTTEKYPLCEVMQWLQRTVNRRMNTQSGRINHVFGGPYKASLITDQVYFFHATKYVYANPIRAGVVRDIRDYPFSSLTNNRLEIVDSVSGIESLLPDVRYELIKLVNQNYSSQAEDVVRKALKKSKMQFAAQAFRALKKELNV